VAIYPN
jgi:acetylornithine deacetylase